MCRGSQPYSALWLGIRRVGGEITGPALVTGAASLRRLPASTLLFTSFNSIFFFLPLLHVYMFNFVDL